MEPARTDKSPEVAFTILGPLGGWAGEVPLTIGGPVQRGVLAMLLVDAGRLVPVSRLVDAVWEEDPPATAAHQIRKAVASLRKRLPNGRGVIVTDGPGYRMDLAECRLDLLKFEARVLAARNAVAQGDRSRAVAELRDALSLWRGPALAGMDSAALRTTATALEEQRLDATEQFYELRLELGEGGEIAPALRTLIADHPLRETLREQLMLALYRSGRQAEALDEYEQLRRELRDGLGIDPGPRLVELHRNILRCDPSLEPPQAPAERADAAGASHDSPHRQEVDAGSRPDPAPPFVAPRSLMPNLPDFSGRDKELSELLALVEEDPQCHTSSPRIVAIDGMGGAGKTSLAVRAAYLVADRFDDGHLSLDLRGFTPGEDPLSPMTALDSLLRAVGIPDRLIPDSVACREQLWQATLADRHMILLLDNAAEAAQVRPLLPASSGCLVLVTSRTRLLDLDGARWISLGEMSPTESAGFVAQVLSREKVDAEPEAAAELVKQCGHLPLALRLATARLRNRPRWTIQYLVERLRDESRRMDELRSNERSVTATLQLSYAAMSVSHREAFRLLALHPGAVVDTDASAALLGAQLDAEDALESLVDAHLLQQPEAGLYAFHDLVRNFARNLAEGDGDDAAAVERLLSFYVTTTNAACDTLFPGRTRRPTGLSRYTGAMPELTDTSRATAWLNREHSGLLASVQLAERHDLDRHVVCLARNLNFQLNARGQLDGLRDVGRSAVRAARRLGDAAVLCVALSNFSSACWKLGRTEESLDAATEARALAIRAGDEHTEAHSEAIVGLLLTEFGRYDDALATLEASIALAKELGDLRVEAESLTTLSTLHERAGRSVEAADVARKAIAVSRSIGYRDNEIVALTNLAIALVSMGEYADAHRMLLLAHSLCNESTSPGDLSLVLAMSAVVARHLGDRSRARQVSEQALDLARTSRARVRLTKVQNLLGSLEASWGNYPAARTLFTQARELAATMNLRAEEAAALTGLAGIATDLDESDVAARYHVEARSLNVDGPHAGDGARPEPSKVDHQVMAR